MVMVIIGYSGCSKCVVIRKFLAHLKEKYNLEYVYIDIYTILKDLKNIGTHKYDYLFSVPSIYVIDKSNNISKLNSDNLLRASILFFNSLDKTPKQKNMLYDVLDTFFDIK